MSIKVMSDVWEHATCYSGGKLNLLLKLADHTNDDGYCWPSVAKLMHATRMSRSNVQRVIGELKDDGAIEVQYGGFISGKNRTNTYRVMVREGWVKGGPVSGPRPADAAPSGQADAAPPAQPAEPHVEPPVEPSEGTTRTALAAEAADGDDLTLPGLEPPPAPPAAADPADDRTALVNQVWSHYAAVFPEKAKAGLTEPRKRAILKALSASGDDPDVLMRAIDGLKSYRQANPSGSQDVSISVIFATGPHSKSNLTDQIEWWANQSNGRLPSSGNMPVDLTGVPSVTAGRIRTYRDNVKRMIESPQDESAQRTGAPALAWLREHCGHEPVIEDGRLRGWRLVDATT